jgi:hypothetical protein
VPRRTRAETEALLAMPGDPDLDCDVTGLVVTAVVTRDDSREILIHASGGHGRWTDADGFDIDVDGIKHADLSARLPSMPDEPWADYLRTLHRWRDDAVPLRMTAAPGRVTLLIENAETFLPFPRRADPLSAEEVQDAG